MERPVPNRTYELETCSEDFGSIELEVEAAISVSEGRYEPLVCTYRGDVDVYACGVNIYRLNDNDLAMFCAVYGVTAREIREAVDYCLECMEEARMSDGPDFEDTY